MKKISIILLSAITLGSFFVSNIFHTYANNNILKEYYSEVEYANLLAKKWIIVDRSQNTELYKLNDNVLRQEISAVARWIAWINKNSTCKNFFKDISDSKPNSWICLTAEALLEKNFIAKNEKFRPEDKITKAESIWMIVKATYGDEYKFDSSKQGNWQKQVVDFAVSKGIVENFSDYNSLATRGFVFSISWKSISIKEKNFSQNNEIKNNIKNEEKTIKSENPKIENKTENKKEEIKNEVKKENNKIENIKKEEIKIESKNFKSMDDMIKTLDSSISNIDIVLPFKNNNLYSINSNNITSFSEKELKWNIYKLWNTYVFSKEKIDYEHNYQADMLKIVNDFRKSENKKELKINHLLNETAYKHAKDMYEKNYFSHTWKDWSTPSARAIKEWYQWIAWENIYWWNFEINLNSKNIKSAFEAWKNSPWHRANMLDSRYIDFWVWYYGWYWVQVFWEKNQLENTDENWEYKYDLTSRLSFKDKKNNDSGENRLSLWAKSDNIWVHLFAYKVNNKNQLYDFNMDYVKNESKWIKFLYEKIYKDQKNPNFYKTWNSWETTYDLETLKSKVKTYFVSWDVCFDSFDDSNWKTLHPYNSSAILFPKWSTNFTVSNDIKLEEQALIKIQDSYVLTYGWFSIYDRFELQKEYEELIKEPKKEENKNINESEAIISDNVFATKSNWKYYFNITDKVNNRDIELEIKESDSEKIISKMEKRILEDLKWKNINSEFYKTTEKFKIKVTNVKFLEVQGSLNIYKANWEIVE